MYTYVHMVTNTVVIKHMLKQISRNQLWYTTFKTQFLYTVPNGLASLWLRTLQTSDISPLLYLMYFFFMCHSVLSLLNFSVSLFSLFRVLFVVRVLKISNKLNQLKEKDVCSYKHHIVDTIHWFFPLAFLTGFFYMFC